MTTDLAPSGIDGVVAQLVQGAIEALGVQAGVDLTASAPVVVDAIDDGSAVTFGRSVISGPGLTAALTIAVPPQGLELTDGGDVDAATVHTAMASGVAAAATELLGEEHTAGVVEVVDDPVTPGDGDTLIRFEIGGGVTGTAPIHWVVEAAFGALAATEVPVTSAHAATPDVAPAAFPELNGGATPQGRHELDLLADVPMQVTVELGRAVLQVRDILALEEGSIVELDREAGASVDVLVNGTLVARGDIVVIDDELGVRITELIER